MSAARTGELRHRADLQAKGRTPNASGGSAVAWTTERQVWCRIRALSGAQRIEGSHQKSKVTHEIATRYATDITPSKRLVHAGTIYSIEAVRDPDGAREFILIEAFTGEAT